MPLSRARDYLSIGEVLDTVREDFPDISISKIRFLESEGLIAPERTAAGYRKFYAADVDRLRYILALQRDQFLPLKVIRDRLDAVDSNGGVYPAPSVDPAPLATQRPPARGGREASEALTAIQLDRHELRQTAGLTEAQLAGLEEYGLIGAGESAVYDEVDLLIARAAARLFGYGIEPRHLRMYRQMADREVAFIEQVLAPLVRRADDVTLRSSVRELLAVSNQLREAVMRSSTRPLR
ncbi:MAG: MerR family transcriptional regulator [Actinomycetota bacterium]